MFPFLSIIPSLFESPSQIRALVLISQKTNWQNCLTQELRFAAEICKFKTNGCSANYVLLKTGSTGEMRTELSCRLLLLARSTAHHPHPAHWGNAALGAVEIQRDEISVAASCCEGMVTNPCCWTLLQQKNNKHLGCKHRSPATLQGATAAAVCLKILCSFEVQNQTAGNYISPL